MKAKDYRNVVIGDFPTALPLYEAGLISERLEEVYCIRKAYIELAKSGKCTSKTDAAMILSEEFPKGERSIYEAIKSIVI